MNVLRGVIRACSIVKVNWIHHSLAQGKWLDTTLYTHNICDSNRVRLEPLSDFLGLLSFFALAGSRTFDSGNCNLQKHNLRSTRLVLHPQRKRPEPEKDRVLERSHPALWRNVDGELQRSGSYHLRSTDGIREDCRHFDVCVRLCHARSLLGADPLPTKSVESLKN